MNHKSKIPNIEVGDFFSFKASDEYHRVIFCIGVYNERSPFFFTFAATTISTKNKPSKEEIYQSGFYGIVNRKNLYFKTEQNINSGMWKDHHPEIEPFFLGAYGLLISRKELMHSREDFEFIVNLPIIENLQQAGNGSINVNGLEYLDKLFVTNIDEFMAEKRQKAIVISSILFKNKNQKEVSNNNNNLWVKLKSMWS